MTDARERILLDDSVQESVATGARWGLASSVCEQLLVMATSIALVRLLAPQDLGLVAAASVGLGLVALLSQLGFATAVISSRVLTQAALSTLYWSAVLSVGLIGIGAATASPLLAAAVGQPESAPYLAGLAAVLVVRVTATVPRALLQRRRQFRMLYTVQAAGAAAYPVVAVAAAVGGAGAWSFVAGQAASALLLLTLCHVGARWRPSAVLSRLVVREHVGLGLGSLASVVVSYAVKNGDYWVVGNLASASAFGVYYVAYVVPSLVRTRLTTLAGEVLMPVFARLQDDDEATGQRLAALLGALTFIGMPSLVGLACLTPELIQVAFGPRWHAAAVPMQLICLAAVGDLISQPGYTMLYARQQWPRVLTLQLIRLAAFGLLVTALLDRLPVLQAVSAAVALSALVGVCASQLALRWALRTHTELIRPLAVPVLCTVAMTGVLIPVKMQLEDLPPAVVLTACVALGAAVYLCASLLVLPAQGREQLRLLLRLVRGGS